MIQYHQGANVASVACPCVRKGDKTAGHTSLCMPLALDVLAGQFFFLFFFWVGRREQAKSPWPTAGRLGSYLCNNGMPGYNWSRRQATAQPAAAQPSVPQATWSGLSEGPP